MRRNRMLFGVMGVVLAISLCLGVALAQQGGRGGAARAAGGFGGMRDAGQMRQMMNERIKEALGATDEEWQVISPRLEKVTTLQRESAAGGGMRALFRGRGDRGGPGGRPQRADAPERERSAVEQAMSDLQQVVDDESAAADQIRQKLTALREAREKAKQQLVKAQQELREVLTLRQEAQLVLFGMLD